MNDWLGWLFALGAVVLVWAVVKHRRKRRPAKSQPLFYGSSQEHDYPRAYRPPPPSINRAAPPPRRPIAEPPRSYMDVADTLPPVQSTFELGSWSLGSDMPSPAPDPTPDPAPDFGGSGEFGGGGAGGDW